MTGRLSKCGKNPSRSPGAPQPVTPTAHPHLQPAPGRCCPAPPGCPRGARQTHVPRWPPASVRAAWVTHPPGRPQDQGRLLTGRPQGSEQEGVPKASRGPTCGLQPGGVRHPVCRRGREPPGGPRRPSRRAWRKRDPAHGVGAQVQEAELELRCPCWCSAPGQQAQGRRRGGRVSAPSSCAQAAGHALPHPRSMPVHPSIHPSVCCDLCPHCATWAGQGPGSRPPGGRVAGAPAPASRSRWALAYASAPSRRGRGGGRGGGPSGEAWPWGEGPAAPRPRARPGRPAARLLRGPAPARRPRVHRSVLSLPPPSSLLFCALRRPIE